MGDCPTRSRQTRGSTAFSFIPLDCLDSLKAPTPGLGETAQRILMSITGKRRPREKDDNAGRERKGWFLRSYSIHGYPAIVTWKERARRGRCICKTARSGGLGFNPIVLDGYGGKVQFARVEKHRHGKIASLQYWNTGGPGPIAFHCAVSCSKRFSSRCSTLYNNPNNGFWSVFSDHFVFLGGFRALCEGENGFMIEN